MTKQEIFDKVVAHFAVQRVQALSSNNCMYRTPDGLKCAIGALIPDSLFQERFEGKSIGILLGACPEKMEAIGLHVKDTAFLVALQRAHDSVFASTFLRDFARELANIAAVYKLNPASLESLEAAATVEKTEVVE